MITLHTANKPLEQQIEEVILSYFDKSNFTHNPRFIFGQYDDEFYIEFHLNNLLVNMEALNADSSDDRDCLLRVMEGLISITSCLNPKLVPDYEVQQMAEKWVSKYDGTFNLAG